MTESGGEGAPSGEGGEGQGDDGSLEGVVEGHPADTDDGVISIIFNEDTGELVIDDRPGYYAIAETVQEGEALEETRERGMHEELGPHASVKEILSAGKQNIGRYTYHINGSGKKGSATIYLTRINPTEHADHAAVWQKATQLYARKGSEGADAGNILIKSIDDLAGLPETRFAYNFKFFVQTLARMHYADRPYKLGEKGIKIDDKSVPENMDFQYFHLN